MVFVKTVLLLAVSNSIMMFAWYGHLSRQGGTLSSNALKPLWISILASWGIAFFEYCFAVPANRIAYHSGTLGPYQLKVLQEVITLVVFVGFAWIWFGEKLRWNYVVSFCCLGLAAFFAFGFRK